MALTNTRAAALAILERQVEERAQILRNEIVEGLRKPGRGRTYTHYYAMKGGKLIQVGKRNKPHTASALGDAPAPDSGQLWQHIVAVKIAAGHWRVGTSVAYAPYLEFGTRRMAPRPFLRPAAERMRRR